MAYSLVYGGAAIAGSIAAVLYLFLFFLQSSRRKQDVSLSANRPGAVDQKAAKGVRSGSDPNKDREPGARIQALGDKLVQVLPNDRPDLVAGGAEAAAELVQELAEFLSRRYPQVYTVERADAEKGAVGWDGLGRIKRITVVPVGDTYDLEKEDPMTVSALLIQDDLAIMIEGKDGQYYLQAGAIVVPGSWRVADKIGMPLDEIHFTGEVPSYKEKLQLSLNRFFRRLPLDGPVVRENWLIQILNPALLNAGEAPPAGHPSLQDPDEIAWSTTMYGREEDYAHVPSSYALSRSPPASEPTAVTPPPTPPRKPRSMPPVTPATLRLRTEHQTLRRLPKTGAIVFTIRTYSTPVEQMAREAGVPGRLAGAVRGMSEESAR
ncbi:hypothetical protein DENSPDRAFT_876198 [Dentipellis sp. KUC8613]|nr:hypothetical protein DENSPDRAFT_876198 [Dentipellis sp. KUC8613]